MSLFPKIETNFHRHIEYTNKDGKLYRVYRPFVYWEYFLMPMNSIEEEMELDKKRFSYIKQHGEPQIPTPNTYLDDDELCDYDRDTSFMNEPRSYTPNEAS